MGVLSSPAPTSMYFNEQFTTFVSVTVFRIKAKGVCTYVAMQMAIVDDIDFLKQRLVLHIYDHEHTIIYHRYLYILDTHWFRSMCSLGAV